MKKPFAKFFALSYERLSTENGCHQHNEVKKIINSKIVAHIANGELGYFFVSSFELLTERNYYKQNKIKKFFHKKMIDTPDRGIRSSIESKENNHISFSNFLRFSEEFSKIYGDLIYTRENINKEIYNLKDYYFEPRITSEEFSESFLVDLD